MTEVNGLNARMEVLDSDGAEILDGTPVAPPIGYQRQPTLVETIRRMVRSEGLARDLAAAGVETFEEADDFEVGEDYDPTSPYEAEFDPTPISELRERAAQAEVPEVPPASAEAPAPVVPADSVPAAPAPKPT